MLSMETAISAGLRMLSRAGKGAGCLTFALACLSLTTLSQARSLDSVGHAETAARDWRYDEFISKVGIEDDVVVFPVKVADTLNIAARPRIANKVAQAGDAGAITVLYPDIGEPYRSVFTQIIDGIEAMAKGRVRPIAVGPRTDIDEVRAMLGRKEPKVVIALGRQGLKVASALDGNVGVVAGGVLSAGEGETHAIQVNSLTPDPELLFSRLKSMMPRARRIYTVYDPRQNEWLIRLARAGAQAQGMELMAYEAQDLRSAMHAWQEIIGKAGSASDAIWLPQDSTSVEESTVLPLVLQESWSRNLAVFSSSFGHVKRGVLFSLYPDNVELGRHLADHAFSLMASGVPGTSSITPLREVLMAVNLRTARHLGLNAGRPGSFDMAFPEP